jgi:hypothetical protein
MSGSDDSSGSKGGDGKANDAVDAAEQPPAFPFDHVVLTEDGSQRTLSPSEFFALPLAQRLRQVVQHKAAFYSADTQLDAKEVLGQIRKLRAWLH